MDKNMKEIVDFFKIVVDGIADSYEQGSSYRNYKLDEQQLISMLKKLKGE